MMIEIIILSIFFGLIVTGLALSIIGTIAYWDEIGPLYGVMFLLFLIALIFSSVVIFG